MVPHDGYLSQGERVATLPSEIYPLLPFSHIFFACLLYFFYPEPFEENLAESLTR